MPHLNLKHIKNFLGLLTIMLVAVSCESGLIWDEEGKSTYSKTEQSAISYITVTINTSGSAFTRAETSGVEEEGQPNENKISNLCLFFYQAASLDNAINNNVEILGSVYFEGDNELQSNEDGSKVSVTKLLRIAKTGKTEVYHVLAVANAGDLTQTFNPENKKGTIRSLITSARFRNGDKSNAVAWTEAVTGGKKSNFIMASERDAQVNITGEETQIRPAKITIPVERMAARIDFAKYLESYTVGSPAVATVKPQALKLINLLDAGSYLFKRVSTDGNEISYLGDETDNNYVLDPWTIAKTEANLTAETPFDFNGAKVNAFYLYRNYFDQSYESMDKDFALSTPIPDKFTGQNYYILDYTLENTTFKDAQLNGYSTGIMFKTVYIPGLVTEYKYVPSTGGQNVVVAGTEGKSFFSCDNKTRICSSLEAVVFPSLAKTQPNNTDFFAQSFTTSNTYQELKSYADRMDKKDAAGFKMYLESKLGGNSLTSKLKEAISWNKFLTEIYGYTNNSFSEEGRSKLQANGINLYVNGVCFYPYWIRHENNNSTEAGIMEFAIVRNNVYKLKILSISSLGEPSPYWTNTTPDEQPCINMEVNVRAWTLREHPSIIL